MTIAGGGNVYTLKITLAILKIRDKIKILWR